MIHLVLALMSFGEPTPLAYKAFPDMDSCLKARLEFHMQVAQPFEGLTPVTPGVGLATACLTDFVPPEVQKPDLKNIPDVGEALPNG